MPVEWRHGQRTGVKSAIFMSAVWTNSRLLDGNLQAFSSSLYKIGH